MVKPSGGRCVNILSTKVRSACLSCPPGPSIRDEQRVYSHVECERRHRVPQTGRVMLGRPTLATARLNPCVIRTGRSG